MARYFNDTIRCYEDGKVERFSYNKWKEVVNTPIKSGYNVIGHNGKLILRHRLIASCFLGLNINNVLEEIDHINRNKIDNRVENLRIVTTQQNQFNRTAKGYTWHKLRNKWCAQICLNGKKINLGGYDSEEEARQSYLDAKLKYHII